MTDTLEDVDISSAKKDSHTKYCHIICVICSSMYGLCGAFKPILCGGPRFNVDTTPDYCPVCKNPVCPDCKGLTCLDLSTH